MAATATTLLSPHHSRTKSYKGPAPHPPDTGPPFITYLNGRTLTQMQTIAAVKCELDNDECLSLGDILSAFQTAINEEQAWALCHQAVKLFLEHFKSCEHSRPLQSQQSSSSQHQQQQQQQQQTNQHGRRHNEVFVISEPSQLFVHRDGDIHEKSLSTQNVPSLTDVECKRVPVTARRHYPKMLTSLGIVLFHALDFGMDEDEERTLSKPLELLIERLTSADMRAQRRRKRLQRYRTSSGTVSQNHHELHSLNSFGEAPSSDEDHDEHDDNDDDEMVGDEFNNENDDEMINDEGIEDCHEFSEQFNSLQSTSTSTGTDSGTVLATAHRDLYLSDFDVILQMCISRLSSLESAESHYKAVLRALVAETLELSTFLDQIVKGTHDIKKSQIEEPDNNGNAFTLEKLQFSDWARLWIQVIRELRRGVKLKKVDHDDDEMHHLTEYELTPYEMLLDDIRSRRYKLNKVMINGDLPPRLKKDAHELILDFIRSRPPLVPASKRILKPAPDNKSPYEMLMESIRQEHKLKPTPKLLERPPFFQQKQLSPCDKTSGSSVEHSKSQISSPSAHYNHHDHHQIRIIKSASPSPLLSGVGSATAGRRKLIKANIKLNLSLDGSSSGCEDEDVFEGVSTVALRNKNGRQSQCGGNSADDEDEDDHHDEKKAATTMIFELQNQHDYQASNVHEVNLNKTKQLSQRPKSVFITKNDQKDVSSNGSETETLASSSNDNFENDSTNSGYFQFRRLSSRFFNRGRRHSIHGLDTKSLEQKSLPKSESPTSPPESIDFDDDRREHVATIWENSELCKSLECLSLTLQEVQHIRSVLTKAEIESLGVTRTMKADLENGKICFTCLKTRFTFWGPWATICKLCNRAICDRCATKMHIPAEQFDRVPIYMLSPTPSPPNEKSTHELFHWPSGHGVTGTDQKSDNGSDGEAESKSLPPKINVSGSRMSRLVKMLTLHHSENHAASVASGTNRTQQRNTTNESFDVRIGNEQTHPLNHVSGAGLPHSLRDAPLVKVCRDCKILVRHLIDNGRANFNIRSRV